MSDEREADIATLTIDYLQAEIREVALDVLTDYSPEDPPSDADIAYAQRQADAIASRWAMHRDATFADETLRVPASSEPRPERRIIIGGVTYSVPGGYQLVSDKEAAAGALARNLLSDLDRSPHGRHRGDVEAQSPTGYSEGNPLLPPGTHIGFTIGGDRIVVPEATHAPESWIETRDE